MKLSYVIVAATMAIAPAAQAGIITHGVEISGGRNPFTSFTLSQVSASSDIVKVRVEATDVQELRGYGFVVRFDPGQYEFVEATQVEDNVLGSGSNASVLFLAKSHEPGQVAIGAVKVDGNAGKEDGSLVEISFKVLDSIGHGGFTIAEGIAVDLSGGIDPVQGIGIDDVARTPVRFELAQNAPNPFNPETTIAYQIPTAGRVTLSIYNSIGQEVRMLVDEIQEPGSYSVRWNGRDGFGREAASGVYFYRMTAEGFRDVRRMMLLK